jgi:hypothetical protein
VAEAEEQQRERRASGPSSCELIYPEFPKSRQATKSGLGTRPIGPPGEFAFSPAGEPSHLPSLLARNPGSLGQLLAYWQL